MSDNTYKWSSPMEWLLEHIARAGPALTKTIAIRLAIHLDSDAIQNEYESEMACDGYFIESTVQENCGIIGGGDGQTKA